VRRGCHLSGLRTQYNIAILPLFVGQVWYKVGVDLFKKLLVGWMTSSSAIVRDVM
jgi:hypothetical protein